MALVTVVLVAMWLDRDRDEVESPETAERPAEPDEPDPTPDESEPAPDEPEPEDPDVLWTGNFDRDDWMEEFGVVVANRDSAEVLAEGPDGRADVLEITFGESDERFGVDYRHAFEELGIAPLEAVSFSYDVYFSADFQFIGDGKLGGLAGISGDVEPLDTSSGGNYDERSFSVRAMWKEDRGVVMYLYARQAAGRDFWDSQHYGYGIAEPFVGEDGRSSDIFTPGEWHRVEHRIELNTPGQPDGVYQLWVDGHRGVDLDDVEYRTEDHPDLAVNQLMSTWFFGGGSAEFPTRPNIAYTDNWALAVPNGPDVEYTAADQERTDD